jgi:hypothetical protein
MDKTQKTHDILGDIWRIASIKSVIEGRNIPLYQYTSILPHLFEQEQQVSLDKLLEVEEELTKLDAFIEQLSKQDGEAALALQSMVMEYGKLSSAVVGFHETFRKLADQRFNFPSYTGVTKLFAKLPKRFSDPENATLTPFEQQVEENIKLAKMDEYEAFNYRLATHVMLMNRQATDELFSLEDLSDPITPEDWKKFTDNGTVEDSVLAGIAETELVGEQLTRKQSRIAEAKREDIDNIKKDIKKAKGDSLRKARRKAIAQVDPTLTTTTEIVKDLINQILGNAKNLLMLSL